MANTLTEYLIDMYKDDSTVEPNFLAETDEQQYATYLYEHYLKKDHNYKFIDIDGQNRKSPRYDEIADRIIKFNAIVTFNNVCWIYDKESGLHRPNKNDIEKSILNIFEKGEYSQKHTVKPAIQDIMCRIIAKTTLIENPFNYDLDKVMVKNGVLDLATGTLMPSSPAYGFTRRLNVTYNPAVDDTFMRNYLNEIVATDRDIALLTQIGAHAITQMQFKKAYICYNKSGNNGKSTFLSFIREFIGPSNVSSITLQDLEKDKFRAANLEGKLANIQPDLPKGTIVDESTFKVATGGDTMAIEPKYQQAYDYLNSAPFIFGCNEIPTIKTSSNAFYNRIYLIEFPNQFAVDPKFNESLFTEENKSAYLNLALEAVRKLKTEGPIAQDADAIHDQWSQLSDNAYRFIKNHMAIDKESIDPIPFKNLHYAYTQFCIKNGEIVMGQNKFKSALQSRGYRIKNKGSKGEQIAYVMNAKMLSEEYSLMLMEIDDTFDDILITSKENRTQGIMTRTQGIMA